MKRIIQAAAAAAVIGLTGCSTIEFQNSNASATNEQYNYWHHNVALSLYELSEPVNLDNCNSNTWSSATVEKDLIKGLAGSVDNFVIFVDVWDPWSVDLKCGN
ncbi:hypothetical protein NFC81_12425 [Salinispirillum sp. LH 10-3-1]|uniref:Uncharacterized protein n=1 Tax=Salinispirillum sp. LH 10-3-1 TaxID=2952525 RepID=A0AB38YEQ4_9GAMM